MQLFRPSRRPHATFWIRGGSRCLQASRIQEIRQVDFLPHGTSLNVRNGSVHLSQRPGIDAVPACILVRAAAGRRLPLPWCHLSVRHGVHDARVSVSAALALLRARSRLPLPAHKNGPARRLVRTGPEHRSDIMQP